LQELALHRNVQAVVHGVVEFPEADNTGKLDDLCRRQMLFQALQKLIGNGGRIGRRSAHIVKTDALEFVLWFNVAGNQRLQFFLADAPAFEIGVARLLQHRAAVGGARGAAIGRAGDDRELALEHLVER
jgi:hypothetical protein